jgi:transposase
MTLRRRRVSPITAEKKLALLAEYDAADREERGALLRREAIYTSHISEWRKQRELGNLAGPPARTRKSAEQVELEKLRKRNEQLEKELTKTKLALEITGKAHALLELFSESADSDKRPPR